MPLDYVNMIFGVLLTFVGAAVVLGAIVWFLVVAFRQSVIWGLLCIFPPVQLVFLIMHWNKAWKPFALYLVGGAIIGLGFALGVAIHHVDY